MSTSTFVQLRQQRNFGALLSATVEYLRIHFRHLFKAIMFIPGPVVILGAAIMGTSIGTMLDYATDRVDPPVGAIVPIFGGVFVILCAAALMGAVVNEYVVLSVERERQVEVSEVWEAIRRDIWIIIPTYIGNYVIIVVGYVLLIIPGIWAANVFQIMIPVRLQERLGFGEALSRCIELMRGRWWFTFGYVYVVSLVAGMLSYAFILPLYFTLFAGAFTESFRTPMMIVAIAICGLIALVGQFMVSSVPQAAIAIHYYNLVERHDGVGIAGRISSIGQPDLPPESADRIPREKNGYPG